jgi:exopolysaccharide production protein ExoZ
VREFATDKGGPPSAGKLQRMQSLRGAAVLMVVLFHAVSNYAPAGSILRAGGLYNSLTGGVDVFFVISGFIIHYTTRGRYGPGEAFDFIKKRLARVVPLYWLITGVVVSVGVVAPTLLQSYVFDPAHALASFAFIPWRRPDGDVFPPLAPGWSLNFEMFFYIAYAMLMLFVQRRLIPIALTAVFCAGFIVVNLSGLDPQLFVFGHGVVFEFLIGVALADIWAERDGTFPIWTGPLCLALSAPLIALSHQSSIFTLAAHICGYGLLTTGCLTLRLGPATAPGGRWLARVGNASYSIYLTHPLLLGVIAMFWRKIFGGQVDGFTEIVVMTLLGVCAGGLCHILIERPLLPLARRWLGLRQGKPGVPAANRPLRPLPIPL